MCAQGRTGPNPSLLLLFSLLQLSKAAMLQKGAEYIKQLRSERAATNDKMDGLRREIDALNNSLR